MNIGMTLVLQAIGFFIFLFVTVKFVLPPLAEAIESRRRTISDGLAEAEKGKASLAIAQKEVDKLIAEAKAKRNDRSLQRRSENGRRARKSVRRRRDRSAVGES
jgi:F-type H+-transporting ATPase subunit b